MSGTVPSGLRRLVIERAGNRCEYCRLPQRGQSATFHVDHIRPRARGGATEADNLALACVRCSLKKGDRVAMPDPVDGSLVAFFNPRSDSWADHFTWSGATIVGTSPTGRVTIAGLDMNDVIVREIREDQMILGRWGEVEDEQG